MNPYHRYRRTYASILTFFLLASVWAINASALEAPRLEGHVNDYAGLLSAAGRQQLEAALTAFEQKESTQIVVLTVASLEGDSLEEFSLRVAEAWKIGQKGSDNGAILLVAKNDRKIRIEVGYGLEGRLTDLTAGRIIRNVIAPRFKAGRFDQGITEGAAAMIAAVQGEFSAADVPPPTQQAQRGLPLLALFALLFLINVLGRARRWMGAAAGAVLFPIAGALFFTLGPLILLALVPIGLGAGFLLSQIGGALSAGHTTGHHRGGRWGGGFGGGGFSSGGGFGGFSGGGGGFGGGGASGGW